MNWTDDRLKTLSAVERANLRSNAAKSKAPGAAALVLQIDALGLPLSAGGLSQDDPLYVEMERVIWSTEAKAAAFQAVAQGLPALAGVDPILQREMGSRYTAEHQGTMNAGYIVGSMMSNAGYTIDGSGRMPDGCVAKNAAKWKRLIKR